MRYLPEVVAACLVGALFVPTAQADEKDRYKEALKRQREDQKRYEERLREGQKRYEERDREERKRYEEQFREDAKRQREFEWESWKRGERFKGGFGGYYPGGGQPNYQFPERGSPYAQPAPPYGGGYQWGPAAYPQVPPSGLYTQPGIGQPSYGPYLGRSYGFSGSVSGYGFSGQLHVVPLAPQSIVPSYPPTYYPNR